MINFDEKLIMIPSGCEEKCRGCKHREWGMTESLTQKLAFLQSKLDQWSDVLEPVRSVENTMRWGYRKKTTISTHFNGNNWEFGMWSRDELIPIHNCPVHSASVNKVLELVRLNIPRSSNFSLAYVVLSGAQVVLVIKSKQISDNGWMTDNLRVALQEQGVEGFWIHLNPSAGKRIFEKTDWHLIWGTNRSVDSNGLAYGPAAFQQLIPDLYNQSLVVALNFFDITENDAVVDLYCGTGNSMRMWSNSGASVMGVELGGNAVECAKINVPSALVLRGACRQRVPQVQSWTFEQRMNGRRILLYVNPPRTGLESEVLRWITNEGMPSKIAYLSCSPGTLSKNLQVLNQYGYTVKKLIPFDFFPQTIQVECLALLEK